MMETWEIKISSKCPSQFRLYFFPNLVQATDTLHLLKGAFCHISASGIQSNTVNPLNYTVTEFQDKQVFLLLYSVQPKSTFAF